MQFWKDDPCKLFPEYCLIYEDGKYWIGIKPNFISDGGSLPRWTWTVTGLTPLDPRCQMAFFLHDGIYRSHLLSQKIADEILLNVMCIEPRPNLAQRQIVYRTLRCVGHIAYNDKSESDINVAREFVTVIDKKEWGIA